MTSFLNLPVQFEFTRPQPNPRPAQPDGLVVGEHNIPLFFVRHVKARRYLLRLRPDGTARVTIPRGGSEAMARQFVAKHVEWLRRQWQLLAARPVANTTWPAGTDIFFRGDTVRIAVVQEGQSNHITFADQMIRTTQTTQDLRPTIARHLRRLATEELPPRVFHFAQQHRLTVQRVTVRNQKSRWGSCSRRGTISLNWRLIQAPGFVADYIILHELMHLRQMNHSRKFWQEVEQVCPDFRAAERWLKAHGTLLR